MIRLPESEYKNWKGSLVAVAIVIGITIIEMREMREMRERERDRGRLDAYTVCVHVVCICVCFVDFSSLFFSTQNIINWRSNKYKK